MPDRSKYVCLCALGLLLALLMAGCAPKRPVEEAKPTQPVQELQTQARQALQQGDYLRAEDLFIQLVNSQGLSREQRIRAWKGLVRAAEQNRRFQIMELALQEWAGLEPEVTRDWSWHSRLLQSLWALDKMEEWREHGLRIVQDSSKNWSLRVRAAVYLARMQLQSGQAGDIWPELNRLWAQAESDQDRAELEKAFIRMSRGLGPGIWSQLPLEGRAMEKGFPWSLLTWAKTLQALEQGQTTWPGAWSRLQAVLQKSDLVSVDWLRDQLQTLKTEYGRPGYCTALLCPMSGPYARIGWKIVLGASVAQWQFSVQGRNLSVHVINTADPGWPQQVADLPASCRLAGGPLRSEVWKKILDAKMEQKRTFFPFRTSLAPGQEGRDGFRFFPGPRDQVRPLVDMLSRQFGISRYAAIYPRSVYGRRMTAAFWRSVKANQGRLVGLQDYNPGQPGSWKQDVAKLLNIPEKVLNQEEGEEQSSGQVIPEPDFQAVFVPDSFSQVQMLLPEFFYFDQPQLVFLGPALWSQGMAKISGLDWQYYRLATMTAPWLPEGTTQAAEQLRQGLQEMNEQEPDFWVALGYDFIRMSQVLQTELSENQDQEIVDVLASMSDFSWSMAPMHWDRQGRASQDLFVVRPGQDRPRRLDPESLRVRWQRLVDTSTDSGQSRAEPQSEENDFKLRSQHE